MFASNNTQDGPTEPPGTRQFTPTELSQYNGADPNLPIYLAIKGTVFDVTKRREMYTPGKGYSIFAGKDASRALGMSSLKPEDCVADYSTLDAGQLNTLNQWEEYYKKRYNIVGTLSE